MANLPVISDIYSALLKNPKVSEFINSKLTYVDQIDDQASVRYLPGDEPRFWNFNPIMLDVGLTEICFDDQADYVQRTMSETILLIGCGTNNLLSNKSSICIHKTLSTLITNQLFGYSINGIISDVCQLSYLFNTKKDDHVRGIFTFLMTVTFHFSLFYANYYHNTDVCTQYSLDDLIKSDDPARIVAFLLLGKLVLSTLMPQENPSNIHSKPKNNNASDKIKQMKLKSDSNSKTKLRSEDDNLIDHDLEDEQTSSIDLDNNFKTFKLARVESNINKDVGAKVQLQDLVPNNVKIIESIGPIEKAPQTTDSRFRGNNKTAVKAGQTNSASRSDGINVTIGNNSNNNFDFPKQGMKDEELVITKKNINDSLIVDTHLPVKKNQIGWDEMSYDSDDGNDDDKIDEVEMVTTMNMKSRSSSVNDMKGVNDNLDVKKTGNPNGRGLQTVKKGRAFD